MGKKSDAVLLTSTDQAAPCGRTWLPRRLGNTVFGWVVMCPANSSLSYDRGREKEVGAQLKFLLRKGWFAPYPGEPLQGSCPSIKWVGAAGMH